MIIYANLQSDLIVSVEKIFKKLICIIIGKTAPSLWGPHLLTEQVCFSNSGRGSLDDHISQSTVKSVHWFLR